ncbi:MAG: NAD-dependent epimerase/dehydratase family protein [Holophagales bacterium]|nr:NAD-dependent epimerase/dehydratase family protein [Holophagales bacterium]MBK9964252.1 NAD-dependent epimerase/dehydratase family protein [Holophagales bacterium]
MTGHAPEPRPGGSVLVTGGAGFIGSHLADALLAQGYRVVVLDDLSTGDQRRVPSGVRFVKGDVRAPGLDTLLLEEKVDTVFHLAAQVDVRKSVEDPVFDAEVNVLGTIRVAQASALAGVAQVVFSSSGGAIYGNPVGERADEEHPLDPCSPYGVAKLAGEKYLAALAPDGGYLLTVLRYANVYGPRQDGRGEAGVIGIWMNRLLSGQDAVVNGDGLQTRDFVHVADVVAANQAAFLHRVPGTFNVGTGVETSVGELYGLVANACGIDTPPRFGPGKPGEQRRSVLDPSRARMALGLAEVVPLAEGMRATSEWFRLHRAQEGLG